MPCMIIAEATNANSRDCANTRYVVPVITSARTITSRLRVVESKMCPMTGPPQTPPKPIAVITKPVVRKDHPRPDLDERYTAPSPPRHWTSTTICKTFSESSANRLRRLLRIVEVGAWDGFVAPRLSNLYRQLLMFCGVLGRFRKDPFKFETNVRC